MNDEGSGQAKRGKRRGLGTTFKRGEIWWVQYWRRGERFRESTGSKDENKANRLLKRRIEESGTGKPFGPDVEKTTLGDLMHILENDYTAPTVISAQRSNHRSRTCYVISARIAGRSISAAIGWSHMSPSGGPRVAPTVPSIARWLP